MTDSAKSGVRKINKWTVIRLVLLAASSVLILVNSLMLQSLPLGMPSFLIGIPASGVFLFVSSESTGEVFFARERRLLRQMLGITVLVLVLALISIALVLFAEFTVTFSLIGVIVAGFVLFSLSVVRKRVNIQNAAKQSTSNDSGKRRSYLFVIPFVVSVAVAFYALLVARTGEGVTSVWLTIPSFFLPVFFVASLSLVGVLFFTEIRVSLKVVLVSVYSFLSHSLFLIVWYPGRYGDPWTHLGEARYTDRFGTLYAYDWMISQRLISDIVKYKSQTVLVVLFRRMFTVDIYWVHIFFIPVLWSFLMPIFSYKLAELLMTRKTKLPFFAALSAGVFSPLILWGAVSVPNSLGFLFFFASIVFLLSWVDTREKRLLFLSLLASTGAFFAHPQVGIFSFILFFVGVVVSSRIHGVLKSVFVISTFVVYPYVAFLRGGTLSLSGLLNLENVVSFQLDVTTVLLVFGFLGLMFSIRGKLVKSKSALLLFLFYVMIAINYYIAMYGMTGTEVPDRIILMTYFLLIPFFALGLLATTNFLRTGLSRVKANPWRFASPRSAAVLIVCLFLSSEMTFVLYQSYPRQETGAEVMPAAYMIDAVYFINSDAPGRYVVLSDPTLATVASGFLGFDFTYGAGAKGIWGVPDWSFWTMQFASKMAYNPSPTVLEQAMRRVGVGVAYFVTSVSAGQGWFEDVVRRTSSVLPVYKVFGDGKLYVFKHQSNVIPISGEGPNVKVIFEDGSSAQVPTQFSYFVESEVQYALNMSGHSSYNITDYLAHWTFLNLTVNGETAQIDSSSDVNTFIYKAGLNSGDVLGVTWQANEHYPKTGWKDDSFKEGWQTHPRYSGTIQANITTTGGILDLSWNFTSVYGDFRDYQYYYYLKNVTVSTNEYPYILIRWKTTGPIAVVAVGYTNEEYAEEIVAYGSQSQDWTATIVKLKPDASTAYVVVGITNLRDYKISGLMNLYLDYILISSPE